MTNDDKTTIKKIGVLTSGGDAQGMNAAVRAVTRAALNRGVAVYAIFEGYQGMVEGGDNIRQLSWGAVGGIMQLGGTVIGSARSADFRTRDGRRKAAHSLVHHGIEGLVVIGGDGSLTGANYFRQEWPSLLAELVAEGKLDQATAAAHPHLALVGLVGSIDNDMFGTDMTIGADSALHRIVEAVDAIDSTAASHQRTFVIEVMGRHCGYLTLMAGLATGADWILIPESPSEQEDWEAVMCNTLQAGRVIGRRNSIVLVAEGAQDRHGQAITVDYVKQVLTDRLGEDTRVTILGHVQRGGTPSAFDRNMSTMLGCAAVEELLQMTPDSEPQLIGLRDNDIVHSPLMEMVAKTHQIAELIQAHDYGQAMEKRGRGFVESFQILQTLTRAYPHAPAPEQKRLRLAVMHSGSPAPGMNAAVRVAVRLGLDRGHVMLAVRNGFPGLMRGDIHEIGWQTVDGWVAKGGAELGTNRIVPAADSDFEKIAAQLVENRIDGLLIIGGTTGYQTAYHLAGQRDIYPAFNIPLVCVPATINNDLPGSELSLGADTALNSITLDVDKLKESAVATQRCFVVEVMGRDCGYLALMSGLASGAERVYLPEEGITLDDLRADVAQLKQGFAGGKRLGLMIRSENADSIYTTPFLVALFEKEGGDLFDVRQVILGHVQRGGSPSPFDRIQATRLAARAVEHLIEAAEQDASPAVAVGRWSGKIHFTDLERLPDLIVAGMQRPKEQYWLRLRPIVKLLSQPVATP
ncbi:MAG: 6-phosphofructokinase [Anaerolineae bacterium]|nr:6-phosphofructokinase [Anaerolineae bacterium]